ncbi:hypothetical protein QYE76_022883 [Lolium multiflorum]|uniref:Reverse transcriptase Ty1/copia-type domain-containing protein n=1 Tax=Lolium multiflorum TaxID=4521 RepID=A0AAD8RB33_LOLMU|nr:hypothetical protein QYE76_022883 [Lolium multiflorum]
MGVPARRHAAAARRRRASCPADAAPTRLAPHRRVIVFIASLLDGFYIGVIELGRRPTVASGCGCYHPCSRGCAWPSTRYPADVYAYAASTPALSPYLAPFEPLYTTRSGMRPCRRSSRPCSGTGLEILFRVLLAPTSLLANGCSSTSYALMMDVSNAFLHGHLSEQVYCQQPTGFVDVDHPDRLGFRSTCSDASLFVYRQGHDVAYLLLYVDDIILTACSDALLQQLTGHLRAKFAIKDLGPLHYFLGLEVVRRADGFFLHQRKYAHDVLERDA